MRTALSVRKTAREVPNRTARPNRALRAGWMIAVSCATVGAVTGIGGSASALPQPSITQVQQRLTQLNNKAAKLGQQYDQAKQQLALATNRLKVLNKETVRYRKTFEAMRLKIGRLAAIAYEQGGIDSPVALLTSATPEQVLKQSSVLTELSVSDSAQISQYLGASRQLLNSRRSAARTRAGVLQMNRALRKKIRTLSALQQQEQNLLAQLTPSQQQGTGPGGGGGNNNYNGPTSTQAEKAVAYAYGAIGCPYVWGATGPCGSGYDCSGLMMASWSSAGIQIPRISYDQMGLPAVSLHTASGAFTTANLQPGDILGFSGNNHVGMWVGGPSPGYVIDAPVPGQNVEKVPLSGWYLSNLDGAVRP